LRIGCFSNLGLCQALLLALLLGVSPCPWFEVRAEFLKTVSGPSSSVDAVYQNTNKRLKVIISGAGLFILNGPPTDLQFFNPAHILNASALHAFVKFDKSSNRYTALLAGRQRYRIKGSFTLLIDNVRLTIDNNNPYLSIVVNDSMASKSEPDILGVRGLSVIVNMRGQSAVALLEANQFSDYQEFIDPYVLENGRVSLKNKELESSSIGLALEAPISPCVKEDAILLNKDDILRIQRIKNEKARFLSLNAVLKEAKNSPVWDNMLILRTNEDAQGVSSIGYIDGKIYVMKVFSESQRGAICQVEKVSL